MAKNDKDREHTIYKVTLFGSCVNLLLVVIKFIFGIIGCSAAMIADAVHSMSDLITDFIVIVFVKLSNKPQDEDHDYGHGKYETLATSLVGLALLFVGVMILYSGAESIYKAMSGEQLRQPGLVALFAAVVSVVLKEWTYRFTVRTGRKVNSQAVIANAWHHRSDAFSSIGTSLGVGGAIFLGDKWVVLDPIAAVIVSFFIIKTACVLIKRASDELLEKSLPAEIEAEIMSIAGQETGVSCIHNLRTRRIGNHIAMEMHLRMSGETSLYTAHQHTCEIEKRLREHFGADTLINIHVEPLKIAGRYVAPDNDSAPKDC